MKNRLKGLYNRLSPIKRSERRLTALINSSNELTSVGLAEIQERLNEIINTVSQIKEIKAEIHEQNQQYNVINQTINKISTDTSVLTRNIQRRPIRVLFLIHNAEVWSSLRGVYRRMNIDNDFEVYVATCNRKYPSGSDYIGEDIVHQLLQREEIPHMRFTETDSYNDLNVVKRLRPDVIFRQSQWDNDIPPAFSIENLKFSRLYSVSYAIMPLTEHSFSHANDNNYRRSVECCFVVNDKVKDFYDRIEQGRLRVIATGHPRVDEILTSPSEWPLKSNSKFKILWSAHHSIFQGWNDFGTLLSIHPIMLKIAKENKDIDFVFSLHPGLKGSFERLKSENPKELLKIQKFFEEWDKLTNTYVLKDGGYLEVMKSSDLLITDGVSLLMEYQLVEKPIIFIEREGHSKFNEFGQKIVNGTVIVKEEDVAANLQQQILKLTRNNTGEWRNKQRENIHFLTQYKDASNNIAKVVKEDFV